MTCISSVYVLLLCLIIASFAHGTSSSSSVVKQKLFSRRFLSKSVSALVLSLSLTAPSEAVSGGGKDFANLDIVDQDFSGQKLMGKDFTQCDATGAKFKEAKLAGARFYRSLLVKTDFTGADLSGASLEDTTMTDAVMTDANMQGSYLGKSIIDVKSLKGADLTDALMVDSVKKALCLREDIKGTPTAESLFCE